MNARARTLTAVLLSSLSFPLTITGASVALPGIRHDLDTSLTTAQWVVNGYNLCFAAFLAFGGSLADLLGRRRLFAAGVAVFFAGSVLCVLARDATVLNLARVLAGTGAAAATATGQSILAATFAGPARTRVFGALGAVLGVGLAFGPTISGLLVDATGWRAVFAVPAALAGVVLLLCPFLPALPGAGRRIDWGGGVLFTAALALLIWVLVETPARGASHPSVIAALLALVACGIGFVRVERRGTAPMFDLDLLRNRRFVGYSLVAATMMGLLVPLLVYLPSYLIDVAGLDAGRAGLWMLMLTLPSVALPPLGAAIARRSPRLLSVGAIALGTAGTFALATVGPDSTPRSLLLPLLLIGTGVGVTTGVIDGLAIATAPVRQSGTVAGLFNTGRLVTETVALALVGATLAVVSGGQLAGAGFTAALHVVATALGCLGSAAAVAVGLLLRRRDAGRPES
ncbi:MFS transporter [Micromonospora sp. CPCC 205546]|uniref:MFS transporter n=1 Tax=Micromonospora sp. CPCC 205546 TaxID=3122397 RepID=UPI002FF20531